MRNDLKDILPH